MVPLHPPRTLEQMTKNLSVSRALPGPIIISHLNYANLPDPMLRVVSRLLDRQNRLEERLRSFQRAQTGPVAERIAAQVVQEEEIQGALQDVLDPKVGIDILC